MKKSIITLLIIAMLACIGLVSCKNEVQVPAEDLVAVSFENDSSRALSASIQEFRPEVYYWKYAAQKADTSNLLSGQTTSYDEAGAKWIKQGEPGFGTKSGEIYIPFRVSGFSQGLWNFKLYAYKDASGNQLVYSGEVTGVLLKHGGTNLVSAVVSPAGTAAGTLKVLVDEIKLDAAAGAEVVANAKMKLGVTRVSDSEVIRELSFITEDYEESLDKGQYLISVQFTNDDGEVVYASGSVVATVYSGLITTVSGSLSEMVTYADFGATSDVIATTIGTEEAIVEGEGEATDTIKLVKKSSTDTGKVSASLSNGTAQTLIEKLKTEYQADDNTDSTMLMNLSVDTTEATETTITYEIGMEAVLTYTKNEEVTETTSTVEEVADFVTVVIDLQSGLTDVNVKHSGETMESCASLQILNDKTKTDDPDGVGFFFYDSTEGKLYIKTWKFSPFAVSYTIQTGVAAIGSTIYYSLEEAVAAVPTDGTETKITILRDNSVVAGVTISAEKNVVLELNGHVVSGNTDSTTSYALITNRGTLKIQDSSDVNNDGTGTGLLTTYIENPDGQDVPGYASNTITNNGILTVESGKIVNNGSGYACYAIDNVTNGGLYSPVLTINGGRFEQMNAYTYAVRMFCNSTTNSNTVVVNGGVITGGYGFWLQTPNGNANLASLTINGGDFIARDGAALYFGGSGSTVDTRNYSETSIGINGGVIHGIIISGVSDIARAPKTIILTDGYIDSLRCGDGFERFVTGGIFYAEPSSAYIADDYYAEYHNAEGPVPEYWTVEKLPAGAVFVLINKDDASDVTFITSSNFSTITDDGSGVPANHTLRLLKDFTYSPGSNWDLIAFNGNDITFDLNGHVYTHTWGSNSYMFVANNDPENLVFMNGTITHTDKDNPQHTIILFYQSYTPVESSFVDNTIKYYGMSYPQAWSRVMPVPNN